MYASSIAEARAQLTPAQRFAEAQRRAATPGSTVLSRWREQRDAARSAPVRHGARLFAGAQLSRLTDSWRATVRAINDELKGDIDRLIGRARELEANNDYVARYLNMVERHVIGPRGIRLQARVTNGDGSPDQLANNAIEAGWRDWGRHGIADITGHMSLDDMCRILARGLARDGEICMQEIRGTAARNKYGYALRIIDVGSIATWMQRTAGRGLNAIVMGVEVDADGRPVAYWFNRAFDPTRRTADRVTADSIIHRFRLLRAEQKRGITGLHAAMLTLHYTGEFAISALLNAKAGSDRLGFFVSPDGNPPAMGADGLPEINENGTPGAPIATSAPGFYDTLPAGYDFRQIANQYPNDVFGPFVQVANQRAAAGLDVSYPTLANNYGDVNFSSLRGATLEDRDAWKTLQNWFIDAVMERIYSGWLEMALAAGAIVMPNGSSLPVAKIAKFSAHEFRARGWPWVDPLKDVQADEIRLRNRLTSPQRILAEQGEDFEDTLAELDAARQLAARYGISLNLDAPAPAPAQHKPEETES